MSRIYDHLKSLETQIEQEKIKRGQAGLRPLEAEPQELKRQEIAVERARRRAAEEVRLAEERAARLAEEARLEKLARERAEAEQAEQAALAARIEAERQLAAQAAARLEQERLEREQAAQRAAHEEQLKLAAAEREKQERLWQAEEQARLQEAAIAEARRQAKKEARPEVLAKNLIVTAPPLSVRRPSYKNHLAAAVLVIGTGASVVAGVYFYGGKDAAGPGVKPVVSEQIAVVQAVPLAEPAQERFEQPVRTSAAAVEVVRPAASDASFRERKAEAPPRAVVEAGVPPVAASPKLHAEKTEALAGGITDVVAANAGSWESRANGVREQLKAENYTEAGRSAQALARDFPERWEPWFWLGTAQLALGQMDAAEAALERAGSLDSKVARVWIQRAVVAQERGDHAAAVRLLGEARDLSPKSPQIYLNLGYSNDALGLSTEAEKNYRRFLSLTEGDNSYSVQRKLIVKRLGGKAAPR